MNVLDAVLLPFAQDFVNLLAAFDLGCIKRYDARSGFELEYAGKPVVTPPTGLPASASLRFLGLRLLRCLLWLWLALLFIIKTSIEERVWGCWFRV